MSTGKIVGLINALSGSPSGGGGTPNAVQFVEQTLTEEQQMQARKNLGLYRIDGKTETSVFSDATMDLEENYSVETSYDFSQAQEYIVVWDGAEYACTAFEMEGTLMVGAWDGTYPFCLILSDGYVYLDSADDGNHKVSLTAISEAVTKVDRKFLPKSEASEPGIISHDEIMPFMSAEFINLVVGQTTDNEVMLACQKYSYKPIHVGYDGEEYIVLSYTSGSNKTKLICAVEPEHSADSDYRCVEILIKYTASPERKIASVEIVYPKKIFISSASGKKFEITVGEDGSLVAQAEGAAAPT